MTHIKTTLKFEEYNCDIKKNGDLFLYDHYAEHTIYIQKNELEEILKEYKNESSV